VGDIAKLDSMAYSIPSLGIDLISDMLPQQGCSDITGAAPMQPFSSDILQAYDLIVLDSPPMLPCADALLLGRLVHGVILVADYRRLSAAVLEKCVARLAQAGAKFLGVVINNLPAAKILQ
jgi:Mrp family chromosome partitioning ATPase